MGVSLAPNPVLLLGKANSCPAGWGKGPAMVHCSLNHCPQPQQAAQSQKGQWLLEPLWAGPIPSHAWGLCVCIKPKHAWEHMSFVGLTSCSRPSSAPWLTGVWEPGCGEGGAGQAVPPQSLPSPPKGHAPTFVSKGEGGRTLGHSSMQVWLHHFVLQPKPGSDAKPTLKILLWKCAFQQKGDVPTTSQPHSPPVPGGCWVPAKPAGSGEVAVGALARLEEGKAARGCLWAWLPVGMADGTQTPKKAAQVLGTPTHLL